jgi:hypothetical protein
MTQQPKNILLATSKWNICIFLFQKYIFPFKIYSKDNYQIILQEFISDTLLGQTHLLKGDVRTV